MQRERGWRPTANLVDASWRAGEKMGRIYHIYTIEEQDKNQDRPRHISQERAALKKRNLDSLTVLWFTVL